MVVTKTSELDTVCEHDWQKIPEEDCYKYGSLIAKYLKRWRICRNCGLIKHVGDTQEKMQDTFQQTKGRQYDGR